MSEKVLHEGRIIMAEKMPQLESAASIPVDVVSLLEISQKDPSRITVETTVTTGFESVALDECQERFKNLTEICKSRGRIFFNISMSQICDVLCMRSVDNVFIVAHAVPEINFPATSTDDDIHIIKDHANDIDWQKVISVWKDVVKFRGICYPSMGEYLEAYKIEQVLKEKADLNFQANALTVEEKILSKNDTKSVEVSGSWKQKSRATDKKAEMERTKIKAIRAKFYNELDSRTASEKVLKYRVTCNRSGKHTFGSQDAAHHFGGTLQDMYNWIVNLEQFDIEIVLNIRQKLVYTTISLTKESQHKRNINHFGPTTLRATVCYNLVRLGEPRVGDVIVDPMAGGGSIPIEGVLAFPATFHVGGDIHPKATARSWSNVDDLNNKKKCYMDLLAWDAKKLPLKDSSVDLFVSDMPFGKRSGSKKDNRTLYKDVLFELGRVVRSGTGRVVILTQDRRSFLLALSQMRNLWKQTKTLGVNIGGLDAAVFVLRRTL